MAATKEDWRARVEAWAASGKSCKAFAREARMDPHTLAWWRWKLRRQERRARRAEAESANAPSFVEVTDQVRVASVTPDGPTMLRLFIHDAEVELPADFGRETLARLLDVLEARR